MSTRFFNMLVFSKTDIYMEPHTRCKQCNINGHKPHHFLILVGSMEPLIGVPVIGSTSMSGYKLLHELLNHLLDWPVKVAHKLTEVLVYFLKRFIEDADEFCWSSTNREHNIFITSNFNGSLRRSCYSTQEWRRGFWLCRQHKPAR